MSGLHPAQSVATSTDKADVFSEAKNFSPRMPERRRLQQFFLGHSRLLGPSATFTADNRFVRTHQHSVISPLNDSPPTRTMRRQGTTHRPSVSCGTAGALAATCSPIYPTSSLVRGKAAQE
ncbi:hypothetical protein POSPLADRAFT_1033568 [Postia placenta MAD-698-R-SB12]|uniref:Uncharacterized protein n=1 Tax=Postia placenta MAD-698-R-SB12 TaxID=670580 RepID=A0A1X6N3A2_9APHY|nr:hypothetical protein POSPLADRAFT_1033568 [Postia placenta MAD-698-R-SB12]OSX62956.1 hypothetical protein POSPLADRAFT_1033568 [Postia placenta MAD-698-R-SB12]